MQKKLTYKRFREMTLKQVGNRLSDTDWRSYGGSDFYRYMSAIRGPDYVKVKDCRHNLKTLFAAFLRAGENIFNIEEFEDYVASDEHKKAKALVKEGKDMFHYMHHIESALKALDSVSAPDLKNIIHRLTNINLFIQHHSKDKFAMNAVAENLALIRMKLEELGIR